MVEPGFLLAPPTGLSLFPLFLRPVALLLVVTTLSFCQSGIVPSSAGEEEDESLLRFVGWWVGRWQWLGEPWHLAPEQNLGGPPGGSRLVGHSAGGKHLIGPTHPIKGGTRDIQDDANCRLPDWSLT